MVQKFVKELGDSAKHPYRSDSAERTATEQVETTAREIVHEAVQLPRRAIQHPAHRESADSFAGAPPKQSDQPHHAPESPRERTGAPRTRPDATPPQSAPTPAPQEQARRAYVQQTAREAAPAPPITSEQPRPQHTTTTAPSVENTPRQRTDDVRTQSEPKQPQSAPTPAPQEQTRRAYVQQAAKGSETAPSNTLEQSNAQRATSVVSSGESTARQRTEDIRTRTEPKQPQSASTTTPQEQGRCAYVKRTKKSRAEKQSAQDIHTEPLKIRIAEDLPEYEPPLIREKPTITKLRGELPSEPTPEKASNVRHIKQTGTWTPRNAEPSNRKVELPTHERTVDVPPHDLPSTPQAQARQAFAERQAQLSQNPSIEPIYPSEPTSPVPPLSPVSGAPATTPKRQPVAAGSSKSVPPVQPPLPAQTPPAEQLPAIREKPKPNAAPREKSRRGVSIRTKDMEQVSTSKAQPKTSVSKIDTKRARKAATQDAQRKMLKKSNSRAARAAVAVAKKLGEAAAKAAKELIDALVALGGGTALFVVFSIIIVAGAFLASPLGILFADKQESEDTVPLATAIAEIQGEYHAELEELQNGDFASIQIVGQAPDWREVVAVFASKVAGAEDGMDVFTLDEERVELLRQVFWDMCEITTETQDVDVPDSDPDDDVDDSHTETALTITITAKTAEQMRLIYAFTKYQNDAQPGDLVFYPDDSHVGIIGGKDADGNLLIVHCSGGANGVVITGSAGFTAVARPDCFES